MPTGTSQKRKTSAIAAQAPPAKRRATASTTKRDPKATSAARKAPARKAAAAKARAPAKKGAPAAAAANEGRKRRGRDDEGEEENTPPAKKAKVAERKPKPKINTRSEKKLDVYVFGDGASSELGLGSKRNAVVVKRPRLNPNLLAEEVGVTQVACGGMHSAAITWDNQIVTWGVNDQKALGRDTEWDGRPSQDEDEDDSGLNPRECVPAAVDAAHFPEDAVFAKVACSDSATFVITDTGDVYGWGTFRANEGILGFSRDVKIQATPILIPSLKQITQIACGSNHAIALNIKGEIFIWGSGQQTQLGARIIERRVLESLTPRLLRLPSKKIRFIGCGQDHSFAIGTDNRVWVWGLNSFGEAGVLRGAGDDGATVLAGAQIKAISPNTTGTVLTDGETISSITGGSHHSIAVTSTGRCLVWGRFDGCQMGLQESTLPADDLIHDEKGKCRILIRPTEVPGLGTVVKAAAGTDHNIIVNEAGEAFSWGFNVSYQCGQGTDDDIETPMLINNTAVRGKKLNGAGGGGQFSVLTGESGLSSPTSPS